MRTYSGHVGMYTSTEMQNSRTSHTSVGCAWGSLQHHDSIIHPLHVSLADSATMRLAVHFNIITTITQIMIIAC